MMIVMTEGKSFGDVFAENAPIIKNYYDNTQHDPKCDQIDAPLSAYERIYKSAMDNSLDPNTLESVNNLAADILSKAITSQCIDESSVCPACLPYGVVNPRLRCKCPIRVKIETKKPKPKPEPQPNNIPKIPNVRLRTEYKLVLPKFDNDLHRINTDALKDISKRMAAHFGGITVFPKIFGCDIDDKKELRCEENMMLTSIRLPEENVDPMQIKQDDEVFMKNLALEAGEKFGQRSILTSEIDQFSVNFENGVFKQSISPELFERDVFKGLVSKQKRGKNH